MYGGQVATKPDDAMKYMKAVDADKGKATLFAARDFLRNDPRINAPKLASIGWCFGGGWSLQAALNLPKLDAAVIYYGRLVTDSDVLKGINANVLGVFGNLDRGIPPESVDAFEAAMKTAGRSLKVLRYDANHAFANPSSGRYDQASATKAFAEVQAFLADNPQTIAVDPVPRKRSESASALSVKKSKTSRTAGFDFRSGFINTHRSTGISNGSCSTRCRSETRSTMKHGIGASPR